MTVKYTHRAHPTTYGGRQYRSRLEAKWAAFFDRMQWKYEYEPLDLGEWSPDFVLFGDSANVFVEVKPISACDADVALKMYSAAAAAGRDEELLIVGLAPTFVPTLPWNGPSLGWFISRERRGDPSYIYWADAGLGEVYDGTYDFGHSTASYHGRIHGAGYRCVDEPDMSEIQRIWADACNAVQWKAPVRP